MLYVVAMVSSNMNGLLGEKDFDMETPTPPLPLPPAPIYLVSANIRRQRSYLLFHRIIYLGGYVAF